MARSALFESCKEAEVGALRDALDRASAELLSKSEQINTLQDEAIRNRRAFSELHHRIRNNFQLLCSALRLQEKSVENREAAEAIANARLRIAAINQVHTYLTGSERVDAVNFGTYATDLCNAIAQSLGLRCHVTTENCELDSATATSIGIVINELVVNAAKYAAPRSSDPTDIAVKVSRNDGQSLDIVICDCGPGLPAEFDIDKAKSLGLRIIRSTVSELGGTLSIGHAHGAVFTIQVPLRADSGDGGTLCG